MNETLLDVRHLKTHFYTYSGIVQAVNGVSFTVDKEKTLGLVGETGCGKTVTSLSIMKLIYPPGRVVDGEVLFNSEDLLKKDAKEMEKIRGKEIAMIFQEPMTSLNPLFTIGKQVAEVIKLHQKVDKKVAMKKSLEILRHIGLPDPEEKLRQYPHELSGGMQQRALIAIALSCHPSLLIADEPTTFLDVTIGAQILRIINQLKKELRMSILYITHNLGVIAQVCDDVAVMYAGHIVERAPVIDFFKNPKHPYTHGLLKSLPRGYSNQEELAVIKGSVPNLIDPPKGCIFHPRCAYATGICTEKKPELTEIRGRHMLACYHPISERYK